MDGLIIFLLFIVLPWITFAEIPFRRKRKGIKVKNVDFKIMFLQNRYHTIFDLKESKKGYSVDIGEPGFLSKTEDWEIDINSTRYYLTDNKLEQLINNTELSSEELKIKFLEDKFAKLINTIDVEYQKTILEISIERNTKHEKWEVFKILKHNKTTGYYSSMLIHLILMRRKLHFRISDKKLETLICNHNTKVTV